MDEYQIDAEQAVIGSALIDSRCIPKIITEVTAEDFSPAYRPWFLAIAEMYNQGAAIDAVTMVRWLSGADPANQDTYRKTALELVEVTPTAANVGCYLDILAGASRLRKLHATALAIATSPTAEGMGDLVESLADILSGQQSTDTETMTTGLDRFYTRHESGVKPQYLRTGIGKLDTRLRIKPGNFVILGGYPSDGKTALALQMALTIAESYRVGFFSLETDFDTLMDRMCSTATGISFDRIQDNALSPDDWATMATFSAQTHRLPLDRIQASGYSVSDVRVRTKAKGYQVIFIDYMQLLHPSGRGSRYEQATRISMDLHNLAQQLGVTVIALSQLSRPDPDKSGKVPPPSMHSLRESGQIEQDADVILLLSESELTDNEINSGATLPPGTELRLLNIAKNKNGRRARKNSKGQRAGGIHLIFDGDHQRMYPLTLPIKDSPPSRQESIPLPQAPQQAFDVPAKKR